MPTFTVELNGTTSITLDALPAHRVFGYTPGSAPLSGVVTRTGTYAGNPPKRIRCTVVADAGSTLVNNALMTNIVAANGVWSAQIVVPCGNAEDGFGGKCKATVTAGATTVTDSVSWSVGGIAIGLGQSQRHFSFVAEDLSAPAAHIAGHFYDSRTLTDTVAPLAVWMTPPPDTIIRPLLNRLIALTGIPWGLAAAYHDAFAIIEFTPSINTLGVWEGPGTAPGSQSLGLATITDAIGRPNYIGMHQGDSDGGTPPTRRRDYIVRALDIRDTLATRVGVSPATIPFLFIGLANTDDFGGGSVPDAQAYQSAGFVQQTLQTIDDWGNALHFMTPVVNAVTTDGVHFTQASYKAIGPREAEAAAHRLGFQPTRPLFQIASAAVESTTTTLVNVTHGIGTDFTPTTGITGFRISADGGKTYEIASGARVTATQIRLTHSSMANQRLIDFAGGHGFPWESVSASLPAANSVVDFPADNSTAAIPLSPTFEPLVIADGKPVAIWKYGHNHGVTFPDSPTSTARARWEYVSLSSDFTVGVVNVAADATLVSISILPVDINGNSTGSPIAGTVAATVTGSGQSASIWQADVGSVRLAHIELTFSANLFNSPKLGILAHRGAAPNSTTPVAATTVGTGATVSLNIATQAGGMLVAVAQGADPPLAFSGDESFFAPTPDAWGGGFTLYVATANNVAASAASLITVTPETSSAVAIAAATWR